MADANQTVLWRYQTPLYGRDLAQVNANVLYPGVYVGLGVSVSSGAQVTIAAGSILIYDRASYATQAARKMVKIAFAAAFAFTCDTATHPRFIVVRYTWVDALDNAASILNTNAVEASDVILAAVEWSGNTVSLVDNSSATKGFNSQFDAVVNNLRPTVDVTASRKMTIAAGRFVYGRSSVSFAGSSVVHDAVVTSARYDVVGIDELGAVTVIKGVEGEGQPDFETFLPIYVVHVRASVGVFLMTDVVDVRPFLTFSGVMSDDNINLDLTGLGALSGAGVTGTLASLVAWLNSSLFSGTVVNAATLTGKTASTSVLDNDATLPTGKAIIAHVASTVASAVAAGDLNQVKSSDAAYITLLGKVTHLLSKDVGMIGWFPFNPGDGWLRANGSVIDSAVVPAYSDLVTKLKAESGSDIASQFYHAEATKAKLPNLVDRYVKDAGVSGRSGDRIGGQLLTHNHGGAAVVSGVAGLSHAHPMGHTHPVSGVNVSGLTVAGTVDLAHDHTVDLGSHTHPLPSLDHSHRQNGMGTRGTSWGTGFAERDGEDESSINTNGSDPAKDGNGVLKSVGVASDAKSKGVQTTTTDGSGTKSLNAGATASGIVPAHVTDTSSLQNTGDATPSTHTHTVEIPAEGESTNEVSHVILYAYIYAGKAW